MIDLQRLGNSRSRSRARLALRTSFALVVVALLALVACGHGIGTQFLGGDCSGPGSQECKGFMTCVAGFCKCPTNICNGGTNCNSEGVCADGS